MEKLRRPLRLLILALTLCACLWIAWRIPYTHDDWDWGLPQGLRWWFSGEMNNRLCGSFFVIMMTRSQLLKTLIMGLTMFVLPLLAAEIAAGDRRENRFPLCLLGCAALMSMPMLSWQQTYGWVSAFSNFVVGSLWPLILILLLRRDLKRPGPVIPVLIFPLALTAQLFAENISAVLAAAALLFALWAWHTGRIRPAALSLLAGALLGLFLMFHGPIYSDLLSTGTAVDGIRKLAVPLDQGPVRLVLALAERYFTLVLPALFESFPAIWAAACAGGLWRAVKARLPWFLILPAALFSAGYLIRCCVKANYAWQGLDWTDPLPGLQVWGPLLLCVLLALTAAGANRPLPRLALLAAVLALAAPFAALEDWGPRCLFPSVLLLLVLGLSLLSDLPWSLPLTSAAGLLLAAALVFHIQVYQVIGGCSALRDRLIQQALDQEASSVALPTEDWRYFYFWQRNPKSQMRAVSFRAFYGLPEEMELIFLPPGSYDVWPDITPEMIYYASTY